MAEEWPFLLLTWRPTREQRLSHGTTHCPGEKWWGRCSERLEERKNRVEMIDPAERLDERR